MTFQQSVVAGIGFAIGALVVAAGYRIATGKGLP